MISIEKSLRHMAWSNQRFFEEIAQLPPSIYGLAAAGGEWPIGQILTHFLNAGEWFRYVLSGTDWTDLTPITNSQTLLESKLYLAELDKALIAQAMNQDGEVHFRGERGVEESTTRSMVLAQAAMHTAEHKGQIATILKTHGFHLDLDKLDLWHFESNS